MLELNLIITDVECLNEGQFYLVHQLFEQNPYHICAWNGKNLTLAHNSKIVKLNTIDQIYIITN